MAAGTLRRYRGQFFLYVGEQPLPNGAMGSTGEVDFVRLPWESWNLELTLALPNWELCWDRLYVFQRRAIDPKHAQGSLESGPAVDTSGDDFVFAYGPYSGLMLIMHGVAGGFDELLIAVAAVGVLWLAIKLAGRKSADEHDDASTVGDRDEVEPTRPPAAPRDWT